MPLNRREIIWCRKYDADVRFNWYGNRYLGELSTGTKFICVLLQQQQVVSLSCQFGFFLFIFQHVAIVNGLTFVLCNVGSLSVSFARARASSLQRIKRNENVFLCYISQMWEKRMNRFCAMRIEWNAETGRGVWNAFKSADTVSKHVRHTHTNIGSQCASRKCNANRFTILSSNKFFLLVSFRCYRWIPFWKWSAPRSATETESNENYIVFVHRCRHLRLLLLPNHGCRRTEVALRGLKAKGNAVNSPIVIP